MTTNFGAVIPQKIAIQDALRAAYSVPKWYFPIAEQKKFLAAYRGMSAYFKEIKELVAKEKFKSALTRMHDRPLTPKQFKSLKNHLERMNSALVPIFSFANNIGRINKSK